MNYFSSSGSERFVFLNRIKSPNDLKKLSVDDLIVLCKEIRTKILSVVSKNGGHLASNLGLVELTVALHKAFNSPEDKIIFDVGHQCYAHKLITGRFNEFETLRKEGGISGFPKPQESKHDVAVSGHASISVSLACGFAIAEILKKTKNKVIAVIGDGALTGGIAYEGLNNGINLNNLIIVFNYNDMSIAKTVGSVPHYISKLRTQKFYISTTLLIEKILNKIPVVGKNLAKLILDLKNILKKIIYRSNFFSDLGYFFLSPVNGHSVFDLIKAFDWAKKQNGPAIIQVVTKKGYGYSKAEKDPQVYHGVGPFDLDKGVLFKEPVYCFSNEFGHEICKLAESDDRICVITAAMEDGTGVVEFKNRFSERFFDVGIAESHAVTFAAGLTANGMLPVFAVYSTFLQRSYDQILHDLAIENLHAVLMIDRAGLVDGDGETHQGIFDLAFLTSIPNIIIFAPTSYFELKIFLKKALYELKGVVAIRYSKGKQCKLVSECFEFQKYYNKSFVFKGNSDVVAISFGGLMEQLILAQQELNLKNKVKISIIKMNKLNPIDETLVKFLIENYKEIFFFEEGIKNGGVGEHLITKLVQAGFCGKMFLTAIDGVFVKNLNSKVALKNLGLDFKSIVQTILTKSEILGEIKKL